MNTQRLLFPFQRSLRNTTRTQFSYKVYKWRSRLGWSGYSPSCFKHGLVIDIYLKFGCVSGLETGNC